MQFERLLKPDTNCKVDLNDYGKNRERCFYSDWPVTHEKIIIWNVVFAKTPNMYTFWTIQDDAYKRESCIGPIRFNNVSKAARGITN